jgi:uncharacterized protein YbaP (TraB family)
MKNITCIVAALFSLLFVGHSGFAQKLPQEKALLWQISGKELSKPSYIYGTIHMICSEDFFMPDNLKNALRNSDQLVIEANIVAPDLQERAAKMTAISTPLSQQFSAADYHTVDSILQANFKMPLKAFEYIQPVVLLSLAAQKSFNCPNPASYEITLAQMANQQQKKIAWLEELEEQMDYLVKSYNNDQVIAQLKLIDKDKDQTARMVALYKQQDIGALYKEIVSTGHMDANAVHWLLEVRNNNWVNKIPGMMKDNSCVFAVGTAHLFGELGIIYQLRKKGYTVTPVLN